MPNWALIPKKAMRLEGDSAPVQNKKDLPKKKTLNLDFSTV